MKVLGLISSPVDPASRIRLLQYIPYLKAHDVNLETKFFKPLRDADPPEWARVIKKISTISEWRIFNSIQSLGRLSLLGGQSGYDVIWQNRLLQLRHTFWEKKLQKPVVFDFDDAIWMQEGEKQVQWKLAASRMIFTGNDYLAAYAKQYNKEVEIVPSTVDSLKLFPKNEQSGNFTIGWIGTKSNFQYLEMIKSQLFDFLGKNPGAILSVVSSECPSFIPANHPSVKFTPWKAESENDLINSFTVGIMPLTDNEWTRGKCSYKILQYLACGKPVIYSPVGNNLRIQQLAETGFTPVLPEDWSRALEIIMNEPEQAKKWGENGRALVVNHYDTAMWSQKIIPLLKKCCT